MSKKRLLAFGLASVLLSLGLGARADTLPAVKLVNGTAIDPTTADAWYNSHGGTGNVNAHTTGLCNLNNILCGLPRATAIQELSRSLSQNGTLTQSAFAQNVFEYVYKNIDTEFRYGLSKGAFGALLDQSGTPFDQANLMVELLRQGNVTANYQAGTISLTPTQFQNWTGLTGAQAACQYLANGGIPALVNGSSSCSSVSGSLTSLTIAHIWVSVNGVLYDPSFKTYLQYAGVDLASAMGCGTRAASTCGAAAMSAAIPASSQGYDSNAKANYVQSIQYSALGSVFINGSGSSATGFAAKLQHYIENNAPTANVQDLVGGQRIDPASLTVPSTSLPYSNVSVQHTWTGDIPDQYRSRLQVHFDNINTWLYADETVGYWIHIGGNYSSSSARIATLFFEREINSSAPATPNLTNSEWTANDIVPLVNSSVTGVTTSATVTISVDHPYASNNGTYMDDTFNKTVYFADSANANGYSENTVSPFMIVQAWGRTGAGAVKRGRAMSAGKYIAWQVGNPIRTVTGSSLAASGTSSQSENIVTTVSLPQTTLTWLAQAGAALTLVDGFSQTRTQEQHTVGVAEEGVANALVSSVAVDAWTNLSVMNLQGGSSSSSFATTAAAYNAVEGSVFEQQNFTFDGGSAIRLFELENEFGTRFYQASSANLSNVLGQTQNYNAGLAGDPTQIIKNFTGSTSPVFNVVVPKNGNAGSWSGTVQGFKVTSTIPTAPILAYSSDQSQIGYVTTAGFKGGGSAVSSSDPSGVALATVQAGKSAKPLDFAVSVATGGLALSLTSDITTGDGAFPKSLNYQRYYNSEDVENPSCFALPSGYTYQNVCSPSWSTLPSVRLTVGWKDNFQIEADMLGDGLKGLGFDEALDAASALAALYTIHDLASAPSFNSYVTQAFVAAWMTDQFAVNSVSLHLPPATETFVLLPDGRYNPRAGSPSSLTQSGSRVRYLTLNGLTFSYGGIGLVYTGGSGDNITFKSYFKNDNTCANIGSQFEPGTWSFPNGINVSFGYSSSSCVADTMTGVSNNLGRSLTFAADSTAANDPDGYTADALVVTDDNGRTVQIRDLPASEGSTVQLALPASTKVIFPDKSQSRMNYNLVGPPSGAIPGLSAWIDYVDTRLSAIFLPASTSAPYLSFNWDGLLRVSSVTNANNVTTTYYPGQASAEAEARGAVSDALGNVTVTYFDRFSHPVEIIDPLLRVSTKAYDNIGRLTLEADPLLGCVAYTYDVRGNLLTTKRYPDATSTASASCSLSDPGTGQLVALISSPPTPITTSTSYEEGASVFTCVSSLTCNKPASQTDANSNVTSYIYDPTTGLLTKVTKPNVPFGQSATQATPITSYTYTAYNGVSLLTQKTEQFTPSSTVVTNYAYNSANKYVLQSTTIDPNGKNLRACFSFDNVGRLISTSDPRAASCP